VARSTYFVTLVPPDVDRILVDRYNKCEHGYVCCPCQGTLVQPWAPVWNLRLGRLIVVVLLMSVLQMYNCMNMYVFGVYSLKNNDVGHLFGLILNGMLGLLLFWIG
jgi:hypothetical protein